MTATDPVLLTQKCFLQDGRMPDWKRLGQLVVAERVRRGHATRQAFAAAAQINIRVLSDIENGRRDNYDKVTFARLEDGLGWETGSVATILDGGDPRLADNREATAEAIGNLLTAHIRPAQDDALVRVMRSDLPEAKKRQIIELLIAERRRAERALIERADELIHLIQSDSD